MAAAALLDLAGSLAPLLADLLLAVPDQQPLTP
jgi:hypothetical protein